ncbi:MAG: methylmalonyl-CoA mutase family protein [Bacteroidaceae bacterium]
MAKSKEKLFVDFPTPSRQEWLDRITLDLKGADFKKKLVWRTNEGFEVQPFYTKEDIISSPIEGALPGVFPYLRGNKTDDNTWFVRQSVAMDAVGSHAKSKDLISKGVTSLLFNIKRDLISAAYIETLLDGIPETIELNFKTCQGHSLRLAETLAAYFKKQGRDANSVIGSLHFDPLEKILTKGKDTTALLPVAAQIVKVMAAYPKFRCIAVSGITLTNSGAFCYQELGYSLAWGNEYVQQLMDNGITPDAAIQSLSFELGIGGNYFMEIAKFRAARMLWAQIAKKHGATPAACKMNIAATTTNYNMTLFDSHVNLLRTQTETMSAALAGVDSILVLPFDSIYEETNELSERLARNQQLLLKEECHLDTMVDAAGGSYYIETLTTSLAEQAWKLFLNVEEEGGMLVACQTGTIQQVLNENDKKRHENASTRREFILGTNQFPNFGEQSEGRMPKAGKVCCGSHSSDHSCKKPFPKLETTRLASDFEALRLQTEQCGCRPRVFMLTIGNLAMRQARAQFSSNFFACAGYEVIDNLGFSCVAEGVRQAVEAKSDIVVLCSSDEEYASFASDVFMTLAERALFVVAGAPACADELRKKGIEFFINVRSNQLEMLRMFNDKLGIK